MQPIEYATDGVIRFEKNNIVRFLLDWASERKMTLNEISTIDFPQEDYEQLMQLIGYSTSGYGDLAYSGSVSEQSADIADQKAPNMLPSGWASFLYLYDMR